MELEILFPPSNVTDLATVVGYLVVSRPFLDLSHPRHQSSNHAELLEVSNIFAAVVIINDTHIACWFLREKPIFHCFKDYYQSGRMLLRMSQALGRIVLAGREMTRLAG